MPRCGTTLRRPRRSTRRCGCASRTRRCSSTRTDREAIGRKKNPVDMVSTGFLSSSSRSCGRWWSALALRLEVLEHLLAGVGVVENVHVVTDGDGAVGDRQRLGAGALVAAVVSGHRPGDLGAVLVGLADAGDAGLVVDAVAVVLVVGEGVTLDDQLTEVRRAVDVLDVVGPVGGVPTAGGESEGDGTQGRGDRGQLLSPHRRCGPDVLHESVLASRSFAECSGGGLLDQVHRLGSTVRTVSPDPRTPSQPREPKMALQRTTPERTMLAVLLRLSTRVPAFSTSMTGRVPLVPPATR